MVDKIDGIEGHVIKAELIHEGIAHGFTHELGGGMTIGKDFDAAIYLKGALANIKRIQSTSMAASILVESARGSPSIRFNKLGFELFIICRQYKAKICEIDGGEVKPLYEGRRLHPYLAVGLPAIAEYEQRIQRAAKVDHALLHDLICEMVDAIRTQCASRNIKAEVDNFSRNAHAKLARAVRYVLSLFGKRSRLLILRVDLYVRAGSRGWSYSDEADVAFEKFACDLARCKIVPDVIGWMSAREDGIERGRHYHVWVALDGHEHHAGASLTKMLGEYWAHECVGSGEVASYFNCFALAKKYQYLGIGMVRCDNADKLLGLYYSIRYLFKEEVMLMPNSGRPRNFRRGLVDKDYVRRGAPRLHDDDLKLARSILLGSKPYKADVSVTGRDLEYRFTCKP